MTTGDGRAVLDGHGMPRYHRSSTTPTAASPGRSRHCRSGAVQRQHPDDAGSGTGPSGVGPTVRNPVTYVQPSDPNITFEDPVSRTSVNPKQIGDVKLFAGGRLVPTRGSNCVVSGARTALLAPCIALAVVPRATSTCSTNCRLCEGVKPNAAGQYVVPVKTTVPEKGEP